MQVMTSTFGSSHAYIVNRNCLKNLKVFSFAEWESKGMEVGLKKAVPCQKFAESSADGYIKGSWAPW